jgi:hypothetical protein
MEQVNTEFVSCPKCGERFPLSQVLTNQIENEVKTKYEIELKKKYELNAEKIKQQALAESESKLSLELKDLQQQITEKDSKLKQVDARDLELRKKERELLEKESNLQANLEERLKEEKNKIEENAREQAIKENQAKLESLQAEMLIKNKSIADLSAKNLELLKKETELNEKEQQLEIQYQAKLVAERTEIEKKSREKAMKDAETRILDMNNQLSEVNGKLEAAQKNELELLRKQRELENSKKEFELEKERQLMQAKEKLYEEAKQKSDSENNLKIMEKEQVIKSMQKTIEELKQKAERGSQQLQGEVKEVELEEFLRTSFITDEIKPVPKGMKGADIVQVVKNNYGQECGTIIWESKRTKAWSDSWLKKLKDDQREANADIAIIVSQALPVGHGHISFCDDVWIISYEATLGIAIALREQLIKINLANAANIGRSEKREVVYQYLCSKEFNHKLKAIVDAFTTMQSDLDAEKRSMEKQWAKRQIQIDRIIKNTTGMYGELQHLIGTALPEVKQLELPEADDLFN